MNDRVAVVVGGAGAIGGAIVHQLRESGVRTITLDLDGTDSIACDVRDAESVARAISDVEKLTGRIDIVVYAAGVSHEAVVWKLPVDEWDHMHAVNLRGAFLVLREAIPILRRGEGGSIVLIGSINGSRGKRGTAAYSASKAGLVGLAKSVARETGRFGITVNVVEPGWVRTPMTESLPKEVREAALAETLLVIGSVREGESDLRRFLSFAGGNENSYPFVRLLASRTFQFGEPVESVRASRRASLPRTCRRRSGAQRQSASRRAADTPTLLKRSYQSDHHLGKG